MKDYSAMSDFAINTEVVYKLYAIGIVTRILFLDTPDKTSKIQIVKDGSWCWFDPCNNPADAWPIIDENNISIISDHPELRIATSSVNSLMNEIDSEYYFQSAHENGLRAAMICYLMMKDAEKGHG